MFIREAFLKRIEFDYYYKKFFFVPAPEIVDPTYIMGRIGREAPENENLPPEQGLVEITQGVWRALIVFIDPRHHSDGQKAAVSIDSKVGSSTRILQALCNAINEKNSESQWSIIATPIINSGDFWKFVREHDKSITSATFEFVAPNMFGGGDSASKESRRFRDEEKAHRIKVTLSSPDHLELDTPRIRDAVKYIERGQGEMKARTRDGKTFNSKNTKEIITISETDEEYTSTPITRREKLQKLGKLVKTILG
jgi:hypothetical protein